MKKLILMGAIVALSALALPSCKKETEKPPVKLIITASPSMKDGRVMLSTVNPTEKVLIGIINLHAEGADAIDIHKLQYALMTNPGGPSTSNPYSMIISQLYLYDLSQNLLATDAGLTPYINGATVTFKGFNFTVNKQVTSLAVYAEMQTHSFFIYPPPYARLSISANEVDAIEAYNKKSLLKSDQIESNYVGPYLRFNFYQDGCVSGDGSSPTTGQSCSMPVIYNW